ncbi:MAG: RHS repeat-associated core domain-containing protein, partial [Hyphomicrobiaceae bacterium]
SPLQNCASIPGVYQWDGTRLAGRTNATGTSLGDYQYAYGWAISSSEGGTRSTLHTDVHGTPQLITDPTAAIAGWTRTDMWGVEKASTGQQSRLGHTGYLKDPLLGDELYAQARQYRAGTGRFTSRDEWSGDNLNPITLNKYLYGNGNPGSYIDPNGRQSVPPKVAMEWAASRMTEPMRSRYRQDSRVYLDQMEVEGRNSAEFFAGIVEGGAEIIGESVQAGADKLTAPFEPMYGLLTGGTPTFEANARDQARMGAMVDSADAFVAAPVDRLLAPFGESARLRAEGDFRGAGKQYSGYALGAAGISGSKLFARARSNTPLRLVEGENGGVSNKVFDAEIADDLDHIERPAGRGIDIVDTKGAVANLTNKAVAMISEDPSIAKGLMSPGSYRHLVTGSRLAAASYGKAVERLVAKLIAANPRLDRVLRHTGATRDASGKFVESPDFIGKEAYDLRLIDITTQGDLQKHLDRPRGRDTEHVIQPGLPEDLAFPE